MTTLQNYPGWPGHPFRNIYHWPFHAKWIPADPKAIPPRPRVRNPGRWVPHQSVREIERRQRQIAAGKLRVSA